MKTNQKSKVGVFTIKVPSPVPGAASLVKEIPVNEASPIKCECGGEVFASAIRIYKISQFYVGTPQDILTSIPTGYCVKCNKEKKIEKLF